MDGPYLDSQDVHSPAQLRKLMVRILLGKADEAVASINRHGLWEYLTTQACLDKMGGVLLARFEDQAIVLPSPVGKQLTAYRDFIQAGNEYRTRRVAPILNQLTNRGIDFLVLKGAALNAALYNRLDLRTMTDIDVLIRPGDVQRVDQLLQELGCRVGEELVREDFFPRYYYERDYFTPGNPPVKIDLHVRPFRPLRYARTVPDDAFWSEPTTYHVGNTTITIPGPNDMLIHLCSHAACHGCPEIRWLYDIHRWLQDFGEQIDLSTFHRRCHDWQLTLPVHRALTVCREMFAPDRQAAPLYEPFLQATADGHRWADRMVLAQSPRDGDHPISHLMVSFLTTPGWSYRFGFLQASLIPDRDHLGQIYPYRHPGWPAAAQAVRFYRGIKKSLCPVTT